MKLTGLFHVPHAGTLAFPVEHDYKCYASCRMVNKDTFYDSKSRIRF